MSSVGNANSLHPLPALYPIVNLAGENSQLAEELLRAEVPLLQLRVKDATDREFFLRVQQVVERRNQLGSVSKLIVNDRIDIAHYFELDGVHLGQDDVPLEVARKQLGNDAIIGLSTHNRPQFLEAQSLPLTYVAVGPIFLSKSKSGHAEPVGVTMLETLSAQASHPVVAIGGITEENAASVFNAGATSVAVISALGVNNLHSMFKKMDTFRGQQPPPATN